MWSPRRLATREHTYRKEPTRTIRAHKLAEPYLAASNLRPARVVVDLGPFKVGTRQVVLPKIVCRGTMLTDVPSELRYHQGAGIIVVVLVAGLGALLNRLRCSVIGAGEDFLEHLSRWLAYKSRPANTLQHMTKSRLVAQTRCMATTLSASTVAASKDAPGLGGPPLYVLNLIGLSSQVTVEPSSGSKSPVHPIYSSQRVAACDDTTPARDYMPVPEKERQPACVQGTP